MKVRLCRFVWPVGFIVSLMGFGRFFNAYSPAGKTRLVFAMTAVSSGAMFLIGLIVSAEGDNPSTLSICLCVGLLFITAVGVGLPYYVPSGVFAVRFGEDQAGVVSAYLDGTSAIATGLFLKLLAGLVSSWPASFGLPESRASCMKCWS